MRFGGVALAALVLGCAASAGAERGPLPELRYDPFAEAPQPDPGAGRPSLPDDATAWRPLLRATLVAGDESLADLGGVVLSIGAETHGYTLVEVRPWEAVFEKDGAQVVLPVARGDRQ